MVGKSEKENEFLSKNKNNLKKQKKVGAFHKKPRQGSNQPQKWFRMVRDLSRHGKNV